MVVISTFQSGTSFRSPAIAWAVFTTLPDGSVVDGNIYEDKCDVAVEWWGRLGQQSHHLPRWDRMMQQ